MYRNYSVCIMLCMRIGHVYCLSACNVDPTPSHTHTCMHTMQDNYGILVGLAPQFQKVHQLDEQLLTSKVCNKSAPAKELKEDCRQLERDVEDLKKNVQEKLAELEERVSQP